MSKEKLEVEREWVAADGPGLAATGDGGYTALYEIPGRV